MANARIIRLFVSCPGDVEAELEQLASVVQELNTILRAFVRHERVVVELVHWKTHVHADMTGSPQEVVDRQLGSYDIYLGVMWSRFGTPTDRAGSGTEHEFRAAYEGWEERRSPAKVLVYFCDQPITPATLDPEQLRLVMAFRDELKLKGLVKAYATHETFSSTVRPDLVLVLSELLHAGEEPAETAARSAEGVPDADLELARGRVHALGHDYDELRDALGGGPERTRRLEVIASELRTMCQTTYPLLPELTASTSPGERLAAVAALQALPNRGYLAWLVERVEHETPFVGYHAAVALLVAARELSDDQLDAVEEAVAGAVAADRRLPHDHDRAATLANAEEEVRRRRARSAGSLQT